MHIRHQFSTVHDLVDTQTVLIPHHWPIVQSFRHILPTATCSYTLVLTEMPE